MRKNKLRYGKIVADSYYPSEKNNGAVIIFCAGIPGKSNYLELAKRYVDEGFTFIHPKYIGSWESYGNFSITKCKETIISFAYLDFDIYEPTKEFIKQILPLMPKGGIIGFDELNCKDYPGETITFDEIIGINKYNIHYTVLLNLL